VLTATDGEDALKIFYEKIREINLVMLDVIMPRMNEKRPMIE
jgi:YesN/AraC family two-component response regulator